jgi:hypothetical protein
VTARRDVYKSVQRQQHHDHLDNSGVNASDQHHTSDAKQEEMKLKSQREAMKKETMPKNKK